VLFAQKKDGTLRMCIDYRALNKVTVKNKYPLPRIDQLLDSLQGATHLSVADAQMGFHQTRLRGGEIDPTTGLPTENDQPKTAFRTPWGLYEWKVLPFGLTNAPATFQSMMNDIFRPYLGKWLVLFIDDACVFSRSHAEHMTHLRIFLQTLRDNHVYLKMKKCQWEKEEIKFLGHVVGRHGVRTDRTKLLPSPIGQLQRTCLKSVPSWV
jgi:hypothetical protein